MYIYLDESGDLRRTDTKYFIIGTFTVGDPRRIAKAFRKWSGSATRGVPRLSNECSTREHLGTK